MMHLKIIKNEAEHQLALEALLTLMDGNPTEGSAEADQLDVLSLLIERYEEENFPVDLPGPIEAIRFRMEQQGLTQKDMVPYFGSAARVSEVLNGKRQLSVNMMRQLNKKLGIPAEVLLHEAGAELPVATDKWDQSVLKAMLERNYFDGFGGQLSELKEYATEWTKRFADLVPGIPRTEPALLRTTAHQRCNNKQVDELALWAWQIRVQQKAAAEPLSNPYQPGVINLDFMRRLAGESWAESGPIRARELLNHHGIHLIVEPHLPKTYLDGAVMLDARGRPIIALTLRHDRVDNFWFTLMHELAHVALHLDGTKVFIDDLDSNNEVDSIESEADALASEALIPTEEWIRALILAEADIFDLAQNLHISPAIVAGRQRKESGNYRKFTKLIGKDQVRCQFHI
ncbi:ImmA/IrrE family metallo-endopeptidase [Mariprofundus sp. KV]|nr:ImmA/IrrE family metallo-endopeptidase [Mariprofundus sp. KV]